MEQIERIITLKHVGATMGSCWLVSSVFLIFNAFEKASKISITLAIGLSLLSVFLIIMSWIKGAQQMHMYYLIKKQIDESN